MAILITPHNRHFRNGIKRFFVSPTAKAEHWEANFTEKDENGNFRELNLAIPDPPVSKEYWEWHMA